MDRRSAFFGLVVWVEFQSFRIEQQFQNIHVMRRQLVGGFENEFYFFAGGNVAFAPEVAALRDEIVFCIYVFEVTIVQAVMIAEVRVERLRPRREHNGFATLIFWHLFLITHSMPELFG